MAAERTQAHAGRQPIVREAGDRRALTVMTVAHGIQHFYVAGLAVTYPFMVAQFHIPYAELGVVLTVAGVLGGLLQGSAGLLRRVTSRVVLAAQDVGMAVAALVAAVAPGFALFGAARVFGSAVSWPQHPVGSAYLSERFEHRRASVLSWHTAGGSIGTAVVPLLASAVIALAGWRWALAVLGIMLAFGALLVFAALPAERIRHTGHPAAATPHMPLRRLLSRRRVAALLATSTIAAGGRGLGTMSTYIPAYLRSGLHLSAITVGILFTIVMVASIGGQIVGGMLADRFGRIRALVVTYLAGAVAIAAFGYAGHSGVLILGVLGILVGALAYAESPLLQSLFSDLTQDGVARSAFGAFFAIAYGVGSIWLTVIGWIITEAGFTAAFVTMAASFAIAALIVVTLVREPSRGPSPAGGGN